LVFGDAGAQFRLAAFNPGYRNTHNIGKDARCHKGTGRPISLAGLDYS
jgi:hypothetical protein